MEYYDIDCIFDIATNKTTMVLVIEERLKDLSKEFLAACHVRQNKAIHPATIQCYHSFDSHHNLHYGIQKTLLHFLSGFYR